MGILFRLLTLPITGPTQGLRFVAETITDIVEKELDSPDQIRQQLAQLQLQLDAGEMDIETYETIEDLLLDRLEALESDNE